MRKATVSKMMYVIAIVMIGILAIILATRFVSPAGSMEGRAYKLAMDVAMYTNSLSSMESGSAGITLDDKYELEITEERGMYYVSARAYAQKWYEQQEGAGVDVKVKAQRFPIAVYEGKVEADLDIPGKKTVDEFKKICIKKESDKDLAVIEWEEC